MPVLPEQRTIKVPINSGKTLFHFGLGWSVFTAADTQGRRYVAAAIDSRHTRAGGDYDRRFRAKPESYLFVEASPEQIEQLEQGQASVNAVFQAAPEGKWYLTPEPTGTTDHINLIPQETPIRQCPFLPLLGVDPA